MRNDNKQETLFNLPEPWEEDWWGMPEYSQKDQSPFKEIIVRFKNENDMKKFMELIEQKFTYKTHSIWYPELKLIEAKKFIYVNEE